MPDRYRFDRHLTLTGSLAAVVHARGEATVAEAAATIPGLDRDTARILLAHAARLPLHRLRRVLPGRYATAGAATAAPVTALPVPSCN